MALMDDYIPIVGESVVEELRLIASRLWGKRIINVNSTAVGGGVAEILNRMLPLLKDMGLDVRWDVIRGGGEYFDVTKKFHNALHGRRVDIGEQDFEIFMETSRKNLEEMDTSGDIVFIHDPQPIVLVQKRSNNKWIWRCHIDLSNPSQKVWRFLKEFVVQYDAAVFSSPAFSRKLPIRQFLIAPSIDPLSDKNRELPQETIDAVLVKYGIPKDKPIITQISRFDRLKDPVGVIATYRLVKKYIDCRLLLAGGTATDDPEGQKVFEEVMESANGDPDIHILSMSQNDQEINALQRASTVIIQKSLKEGFGLTVSEALWKSKPVVASNVGGIPLQIKHKHSGLLCYSAEGAAFA
ncbi:MAG: glycosyltransferase, partial [Proteobacteria bacterium]|nr:glycosyltransferase [Pseudomonadota bacterium]